MKWSFATFESLSHICLLGVEKPKLILIVGCVGLALNIISATFLHGWLIPLFSMAVTDSFFLYSEEHDHDHGTDHTHDRESAMNEGAEASLGEDMVSISWNLRNHSTKF